MERNRSLAELDSLDQRGASPLTIGDGVDRELRMRNASWICGPEKVRIALSESRGECTIPLISTGRRVDLAKLPWLSGPIGSTAWVRQPLASKYSTCVVPGYAAPGIKVFPRLNGRAIVIMRPQVHPDGSLCVISDRR